jgi:hypothetical protein
MRSIRIVIVALILSAGIGVLSPSRATAYWITCSWPNSAGRQTIKTRYLYTSASPYFSPSTNARSAWNTGQGAVTLSAVSSGEKITIYETNLGNTGQAGVTSATCSGGTFSGTTQSRWNQYYTDGYSATAKQAVMVHELGHAIGADHNGSICGSPSIMTATMDSYFTCGWSSPQLDDKNGIETLYSP